MNEANDINGKAKRYGSIENELKLDCLVCSAWKQVLTRIHLMQKTMHGYIAQC